MLHYKFKNLPLVGSLIEKGEIPFIKEENIKRQQDGGHGKIHYIVDGIKFSSYILAKNVDALKYFLGLRNENPEAVHMMACIIDTMPNVWKMVKYESIKKYFTTTLNIVSDDKISGLAKRPVILIFIDNDKLSGNGGFTQQFHEAGNDFTRIMELKNLIIYKESNLCSGISDTKAPTLDLFADMIRELSALGKITDVDRKLEDIRQMFQLLEIVYKDV